MATGAKFLSALALVPCIFAPVDRASMAGTVTDTSGAVVPGAKITITSQETGFRREAMTGANGAASKILGGWETSGIWTARTGRMLTVTIARAAGAVPDANTSAAFAIPANGTWGKLFHTVQAGNPGTVLTSPASFGLVTSGLNRTIGTGTSRQLQLALRLNF